MWIIGRTKTDGPQDYDAVHEIQAGFKVTPLSEWGRTPRSIERVTDPSVDMKTPPKAQVDAMAGEPYFTYAAEVLKANRPHLTDEPIIAQMRRIGIEPGKSFDFAKAPAAVRAALEAAPAKAQKLMDWKLPTLARVANTWSMNTDTMGVYGNYYLKRAIVAQLGLGANLPEDAIYPVNLGDQTGRPLDGANKYSIHFDGPSLPPVEAFWSVTLYDPEGYQVRQPPQPLRAQQLDAVQVRPGWVIDPLSAKREPRQGQGGQLAAGAEGSVHSDHAALCAQVRGADGQVGPPARHKNRGLLRSHRSITGLTGQKLPRDAKDNDVLLEGVRVAIGCSPRESGPSLHAPLRQT